MKKKNLAVSLMLMGYGATASEMPIEVVQVVGFGIKNTSEEVQAQQPVKKIVHDAGELLRSINGMTATRRGGRGFEPIIRGQSQNQLNVMTDGAFTFGGCPGRMDPPTTYTALENFDSLTVIKGHRSVIYGSGGSGGTLLFEHKRPDFEDRNILGSVHLNYTGNSEVKASSVNMAVGNDKGFLRAFGDLKSAENYQDGDGNETAAAFDSNSVGLIAGADLNSSNYLQLSYEGVREDDVWYAGNGMDSPWTESDTYRVKWVYSGSSIIDGFEFSLYQSNVDHLMDNYTVRNRMPMNENGMTAPTTSETRGGRWIFNVEADQFEWRFGADYRANDRQADLFMDRGKDGSNDMLVSVMWPGVEQSLAGIFAEVDTQAGKKDILRLGLRVDQFAAEATRASESVGMAGAATPNTFYLNTYGIAAEKVEETSLSAVAGWDRSLSGNIVFSTNLSRSVRTPDATEQFIARSAMGSLWVGRPDIESEKHHQLDFTLLQKDESQYWSATIFWDEVTDYIERYKSEKNTLYRNIDASLYGVELEADYRLGDHWGTGLGVSYTRGKGDEGDLARISPLELRANLEYSLSQWEFGFELVANGEQDNYDPDNDAGETESFTVINLYSHWQPTMNIRVQAGIENLFDETYAYHVNTANSDPFNPDPIRVNEPGRQAWVKARYQF